MPEWDCVKSTWNVPLLYRYELLAAQILLHRVACIMNFADQKYKQHALNSLIYFDTLGRKEK